MANFTKGPWDWEFSRTGDKRIALSDEVAHDVLIATKDLDGRCFIEVSEADASLIAAAPDLLEACEAAKTLIEDMSRFVGQMALKNYALFNEAPIALYRAMTKARKGVSDG